MKNLETNNIQTDPQHGLIKHCLLRHDKNCKRHCKINKSRRADWQHSARFQQNV